MLMLMLLMLLLLVFMPLMLVLMDILMLVLFVFMLLVLMLMMLMLMLWCYAFDAGNGVYSGADVVDADAGADVFVYICIGKLRQKVSYLSLHLKGLLTAVESLHL